jgi:hypothetical protein
VLWRYPESLTSGDDEDSGDGAMTLFGHSFSPTHKTCEVNQAKKVKRPFKALQDVLVIRDIRHFLILRVRYSWQRCLLIQFKSILGRASAQVLHGFLCAALNPDLLITEFKDSGQFDEEYECGEFATEDMLRPRGADSRGSSSSDVMQTAR